MLAGQELELWKGMPIDMLELWVGLVVSGISSAGPLHGARIDTVEGGCKASDLHAGIHPIFR